MRISLVRSVALVLYVIPGLALAQSVYIGPTIHSEPLDDHTEWTKVHCSAWHDTTHYKCAGSNFQSIRIMPDGTNATSYILKMGLSLNLEHAHGMLRVYVPEGTGASHNTNISLIYVCVRDASRNAYAYYLWRPAPFGYPGWSEIPFLLDEYDWQSATPPNMAAITEIDLCLKTIAPGYTPEVVFDQLKFYKPRNSKGLVLIRMDGCYARQWKGCAYLAARKMTGSARSLRATLCVAKYNVDKLGPPGYLSVSQLRDLDNAGHQIAIYLQQWHNMSEEEKQSYVDEAQEWMAQNGFASTLRYAAHASGGYWTNEDINRFVPARFDAVLGGRGPQGSAKARALWNPRFLPWAHFLKAGTPLPTTSLDRAAASKGLFVYGCHLVNDEELIQFKRDIDVIVDKINEGNLIPVTMHEVVSGVGLTPE